MARANERRYLQAGQVADLLLVSRQTVHRWSVAGRLPFVRTVSGRRRYPEAEIGELVERLRGAPEALAPPVLASEEVASRLTSAEQAQIQRLLGVAITIHCPVRAGRAFDELVYRLAALRIRIDLDAPAARQPGPVRPPSRAAPTSTPGR